MMANRSVFLHKFFDAPTKIGSVTPSSRFLTQKMLGELPWDEMESIVELGAGTGVFTEYIAQHKKESCKAVIIEQDTFMLRELEHRFPELLYGSQAENLPFILQKFGLEKVDCIIGPSLRNFYEGAADADSLWGERFIKGKRTVYSLSVFTADVF